MERSRLTFQWWVFCGALALSILEVLFEVHVPGTDVFLFKEAGVNLATKGKFVASYLPHMAFGEEKPFAYYPPIYPFVFGVWSWIVGVGLKQSLLFDSFLTLIRTMLMLQLIAPSFSDSFFDKKHRIVRWATAIFFCLFSLISTDRDRPDELALIWGLLLCVVLKSSKEIRYKLGMSSILLACVGATSPACGVLFGLIFSIWCLSQERPFHLLVKGGTATSLIWGMMVVPVFLGDFGSGMRFSKQAGISSLPYLRNLPGTWTWIHVWDSWRSHLNIFWNSGRDYVLLAFSTFVVTMGLWVRFRKKISGTEKVMVFSSLGYCLIVPLIWTLQPYYLWFSSVLLVSSIFQALQRFNLPIQKLIVSSLFFFVIPLWIWEAKCVLNAIEMPKAERSEEIRRNVLARVEPNAKLAVTHDQYFTFRNLKEVVNLAYWSNEVVRFDYLYITDLPDSRRRIPRVRQLLSKDAQPCFELVKDFSTHTPFWFVGRPTEYFVRGNGGGLFKNICKEAAKNS